MTDKPKWTDLFGIDPDYTKDAAEEPKYTESELRVLTEAALRLGRKEAGEEIAERIKAEINDFPSYAWNAPDVHRGLKLGYVIAQDVASQPAPDASSARTDLSVDTDLPQDPKAVREPQEDGR